jgi:hypothetical protein
LKTLSQKRQSSPYIIKGMTHQEDLTIVNIYVSNVGVPNFIKEILMGDFNTPLSSIESSSRQ